MESGDSNLRSVFDLCSPDKDGFILTDYLADKLAEQFSDQALVTVQKALDPEHVGRISFPQFCTAVTKLQSKKLVEEDGSIDNNIDDDDSSDPENTYNEYDIPEDEISEMENLEIIGESQHGLSPTKPPDTLDYLHRRGSYRRSHRRAKSWTLRPPQEEKVLFDTSLTDTSATAAEFDDLSEKVDELQGHVSRLEEEKTLQTQYEIVKQENHQLTNRVNELEEKLQDLTDRNEELKKANQHRLEDLQREHNLELQVMRGRIEVLTVDKERMTSELSFTKSGAKETRQSLTNIQSKSDVLTKQIMETNEEYRRLNKCFTAQQDKHEIECSQLREEVKKLKQHLAVCREENIKLKSDLSEIKIDPSSARMRAHVDNLKAENDELKRNNEDLSDQLTHNLTEARLLMGCGDHQSIAQELSGASRDEVMEALKKQEDINDQLREYLERITLNILERDPGILEIK